MTIEATHAGTETGLSTKSLAVLYTLISMVTMVAAHIDLPTFPMLVSRAVPVSFLILLTVRGWNSITHTSTSSMYASASTFAPGSASAA
jgi:hypothetical protein